MQTVLFLDDDEIFLQSMRRVVQRLDVHVVTATSLQQGIEVLANLRQLDVAFLDYHLPDGTGLQMIGPLKEMHPLSSAILLTGEATMELAMDALRLGVHGCLLKGGTTNEIRMTCSQALERTRLLRDRADLEEQQRELNVRLLSAASEWNRTFDSVDSPIVVVDAAGTIRRLNRAAQELIEAPYNQIVGLPLARVPGEPWSTATDLVSSAAVTTRQAFDPVATRTWEVTVNRLAEDRSITDTGSLRFVVTAREVTALLELQSSVERGRIMAAMGALVGEVAHEVRNPLFALSATLDIVDASWSGPPESRRHLDTFRAQIGRVRDLMADLLEYGKPASQVPAAAVNLADLVTENVLSADGYAHERGVALKMELAASTPMVQGDRARLSTASQNLIRNAIQHAPANSVVRISLRRLPRDPGGASWAELAVADSGPGFREEDLPKIFLPFFSRRESGTGLGLAIVHHIVEGHGGRLAARNLPNGGALVSFRLPVLDPQQAAVL